MIRIKHIIILFLLIGTFVSCETDDNRNPEFLIQPFVRFNLLVNSNNEVLEFPTVNTRLLPVQEHTYSSAKPLKIPVTLTSPTLMETVAVTYKVTSDDNLDNITFSPQNELSFSGNQLTDTIFVTFNERWQSNPSFTLTLESVSDPSIKIDNLNDDFNNRSLKVTLGDPILTYTFEESRIEIEGYSGEIIDFFIMFPNGFFPPELENVELISTVSPFDITIERLPASNNLKIPFRATINEDLPEDISLDALVNLIDFDGRYRQGAINCLQLNKPIKVPRFGNPAANFYNLSDPFYRLRGYYWRVDTDIPGACEWFSSNTFAVPVQVVNPDTTNVDLMRDLKLYNDFGTETISDDIYHHRFKIGFVGPNPPIGTNPFAIRNILNGDSSSSPGYNLLEALEFFPENFDSETGGAVSVISQKLSVKRISDDKFFSVPISGSGTYKLIDNTNNLWRIDIDVTYDFTIFNGGIVTLPIVLYNQSGQPKPELSSSACIDEIEI